MLIKESFAGEIFLSFVSSEYFDSAPTLLLYERREHLESITSFRFLLQEIYTCLSTKVNDESDKVPATSRCWNLN